MKQEISNIEKQSFGGALLKKLRKVRKIRLRWISFLTNAGLQVEIFLKEPSIADMFFCEFKEIIQSVYSAEHQ